MPRSPRPDKTVHLLTEKVSDVNRIWSPIRLQPPTPPKSHEAGDNRNGYTYDMYLADYEKYLLALSSMKHIYLRTQRRDGTGVVDMTIARRQSPVPPPVSVNLSFIAVDEDDSSTVTDSTSMSDATTGSFESSYVYDTQTIPANPALRTPMTRFVTATVRTGGKSDKPTPELKALRRKEKRNRQRARRAARKTAVETASFAAAARLQEAKLDALRSEGKVKKALSKLRKPLGPSAVRRRERRLAQFGPPRNDAAGPQS